MTCGPSKRSDEICSETSPTRNTIDGEQDQEDGAVRNPPVHREVPDAVGRAGDEASALIGTKMRSGLKMRDDLQQDQQELGAVAREADLRLPDALPRVDRLERDVVAGLDERQRRRRRRREAVRAAGG